MFALFDSPPPVGLYSAQHCQYSQREAAAEIRQGHPSRNTYIWHFLSEIFSILLFLLFHNCQAESAWPSDLSFFETKMVRYLRWYFPRICSVFRSDLASDIYQLFCCRIFANKAAPQNIGTIRQLRVDAGWVVLGWPARLCLSVRTGAAACCRVLSTELEVRRLQPRTLQTCSRVAIIITTNNCVSFYSTICTLSCPTTTLGTVLAVWPSPALRTSYGDDLELFKL